MTAELIPLNDRQDITPLKAELDMKKKYNEFKKVFLRPQPQQPQQHVREQAVLPDRSDLEHTPLDKDMVDSFVKLVKDFRAEIDLLGLTPTELMDERISLGRSIQDMQEHISILKTALEKMIGKATPQNDNFERFRQTNSRLDLGLLAKGKQVLRVTEELVKEKRTKQRSSRLALYRKLNLRNGNLEIHGSSFLRHWILFMLTRQRMARRTSTSKRCYYSKLVLVLLLGEL